MAISKFKLPRRLVSPRQISKGQLRERPVNNDERVDPLASWEHGFATRAAQDYFDDNGLRFPDRPEEDPDLPSDVTALPSEELGKLHAQFVAYTEFLETRAALAEIDQAEADAFLAHVEAEVRLTKSGTVQDKAAKTLQDPRYIEHEIRAMSLKAKAKLLRARVKGYERCASALSREMTRRLPLSEH